MGFVTSQIETELIDTEQILYEVNSALNTNSADQPKEVLAWMKNGIIAWQDYAFVGDATILYLEEVFFDDHLFVFCFADVV